LMLLSLSYLIYEYYLNTKEEMIITVIVINLTYI